MTRSGILFILAAFVLAAFTQMIVAKKSSNHPETEVNGKVKIPKKVQAVIDKSCYGCHSENGKSDDAKEALRWDKFDEYDNAKLVSIMDEIIEVIEKQEMPPEKFLNFKPDAKPTEEEYATLMKWADKEADKLTE
jgi:uncharacterized membrane protein